MDLGAVVASWSLPAFTTAFLLLAAAEMWRPRQETGAIGWRWFTNFALYAGVLVLIATLPVDWHRLLFQGWTGGLFAVIDRHGGAWATMGAGLLVLDALSYAQHRIGHLKPFWRFHAVHHADAHVDLTTSLRHHPGEFLVNAAIGAAVLTVLGLPAYLAAVYGLAAALFDLWTHANLALPPRLEAALAWIIMTPGQHRIHHSSDVADYDTNFGTVLTAWDRLFGTWRPPTARTLRFGLTGVEHQGLFGAIIAPFSRHPPV